MTSPVPAARPKVVLFDVFETMLQLEALRPRFEAVGRPGHELELFFARTLRDGMAYTLAGAAPPFPDVARAQLRTTCGLVGERADHILAGFRELPAQPDVAPALRLLAAAEVPAYAFTHGVAEVAVAALAAAGIDLPVLSTEALASFKPPARVYHWACAQTGSAPERTALVAVHSWDTHGALRAGLLAGFATRHEGGLTDLVARPHAVAETLDEVVATLLALP
ncbi:HAD family hydrolase [Actinokineospora sp.]|uniref:HAD family hydrolase n=1 Tax=Actinokineospora sp. TaxID=1872133 RepID=UPI0040379A9B